MLFDGFPTPSLNNCDVQVYRHTATVDFLQWQTWRRPAAKGMCFMFALAGGGGGGGGFTRAAAAAGGGGGGGGSGAQTSIMLPMMFVPDMLYIQVGAGGKGVGSGGGAAGSGVATRIADWPNTSGVPTNFLLSAGGGGGGGTGTGAAVGAAGSAGSAGTIGAAPLAGGGLQSYLAGQAGGAGGAVAGAIGTAVAIPLTGLRCMGGPGGAGTTSADFAGGVITSITSSLISERAPIGPAAGTNNGSGGYLLLQPWFSYCGLGGSSANATAGGAGGNAAFGSGGGGGGAGTTGGQGGDGGDGIVIIVCW